MDRGRVDRTGRLIFPAWLLAALLGGAGLLWSEYTRLQTAFDTDARILHRVLSQKLAQQEALLGAVDALDRQGVGADMLSRYVGTLLRPYPQVVAVQRCAAAGCTLLGTPAGAPPKLPASAPTRPTVLWAEEGGRGTVYALAVGRIRVWVDADRLLGPEAQAAAPLAVTLLRPGSGQPITRQGQTAGTWPAFRVQKTLGTVSQAFPIRIERHPPLGAWPWAAVLAWAALTGAVAWGAARAYRGRAQAQQAAADERARAQGVVQAATEGIVALDGAHRVTLANPAAQRILGHPLPPGVDVRELARFRATLAQAPFDEAAFWHSAQPTELPEGLALVRGGGDVLVEGSLAPLLGSAGTPRGRVLLLREVGPLQRRMLEQLESGERRIREHETMLAHVTRLSTLGEMSAGLAHELNQPLTAIVSYGQATARLLDGPDAELERARQTVGAMVAQARRAAGIIERLRRLMRRAPSQPVPVDLAQAAHNILTLCQADLRSLEVRVHTDFPAHPCLVTADPVGLEQIILNLVRNALDALRGAPRRELTLRISPIPSGWQLSVRDSGPGLPDELLPGLFTPFQTTKPQGLGLGLSLSQTLAQGMGGDLSGANAGGEGAAGGAVFRLTLARAQAEAADD